MFMKRLAKRNKPIIILNFFIERVEEDSISFLKNLIIDIKTNKWYKINFLKVIKGFLKNDVKEWYIEISISFNIKIILEIRIIILY